MTWRRAAAGVAGAVLISTMGWAPASAAPTSFTFVGSGFGHGVGLSQYGAQNMALEGMTSDQITAYYYSGTRQAPVQDDLTVRVNLLAGASTVNLRSRALDATPMAPSDDPASPLEITVGTTVFLGNASDSFSVRPRNGALEVTQNANGVLTVVGSGPSVTVRWSGTRDAGQTGTNPAYVDVAGPSESFGSTARRYKYGIVSITASTTNNVPTMNVVNQVRLKDEYLYGLAEVPSSWENEALKAQAVVARSYALVAVRSGTRSSCACNVFDGTSDQVFAGMVKEVSAFGEKWKAAVDATNVDAQNGLGVFSGTTLVKGFFYSSSGGRTQNSEEVWSATLPWLRSVDDPWSMRANNPNRQWTATVGQPLVAAAFGLPDVNTLAVTARTAGNGVKTIAATATDGTVRSLSGEVFRSRLGLKATWITQINGVTASPTPAPTTSPTTSPSPSTSPTTSATTSPSPSPSQTTSPAITPTPTPTVGARVTLEAPASATVGQTFTMSGAATGAGSGATVQRFLLVNGVWSPRGSAVPVTSTGAWTMSVVPDVVGTLTYRIYLRNAAGTTLAVSPMAAIIVNAPSPTVSMASYSSVTVGEQFNIVGKSTLAPAGSTVQRQVLVGDTWANRGNPAAVAADGTWSMTATAPTTEQSMVFRALLVNAGRVLATSNLKYIDFVIDTSDAEAPTPTITVVLPRTVKVGTAFTMRGTATAYPAGSVVIRKVLVGTTWTIRGTAVPITSGGTWTMPVTAPAAVSTLKFRFFVMKGSTQVVASSVRQMWFVR